jgi:glycosyltransferase involved in cell wall biosynthesis
MRQVCLVVPCYNEARRLRGDRFGEFLASRGDGSVCFVNDGSTDGTLGVLETLKAGNPGRILVVNLARNGGKAEAVRQGVLHAAALDRFAFIGYWDADLSTPLGELDTLLAPLVATPGYRLALGSRVKRLGSNIERDAARHYLGRVFSTLSSQLLDLAVYDSQCGAKLFRADIADVLFRQPFVTRWSFDLEILVRLRRHLGPEAFRRSCIEVPLTEWREIRGSKLTLLHMLRMPLEVLSIRRHYGYNSSHRP